VLGASDASAGPGFPEFRFAQTFGLTRPSNPLRILLSDAAVIKLEVRPHSISVVKILDVC
jgi:hypothetical protein